MRMTRGRVCSVGCEDEEEEDGEDGPSGTVWGETEGESSGREAEEERSGDVEDVEVDRCGGGQVEV
jgi:hypothetical protein